MVIPAELIAEAAAAGVRLTWDSAGTRIAFDRARPPAPELVERLRAHRSEILAQVEAGMVERGRALRERLEREHAARRAVQVAEQARAFERLRRYRERQHDDAA